MSIEGQNNAVLSALPGSALHLVSVCVSLPGTRSDKARLVTNTLRRLKRAGKVHYNAGYWEATS